MTKDELADYLANIPPATARAYPVVVITAGGYVSVPMTRDKAAQWLADQPGNRIVEIQETPQ